MFQTLLDTYHTDTLFIYKIYNKCIHFKILSVVNCIIIYSRNYKYLQKYFNYKLKIKSYKFLWKYFNFISSIIIMFDK